MQTKTKTVPDRYSPGWMQQLDGRTQLAQELRNRYQALASDLGGHDSLSYQERSLVDRALFLELHLQQEEERLASGKDFDSGKWVQACNALSGIFAKLGLHKRTKDVPDLASFIQSRGSK